MHQAAGHERGAGHEDALHQLRAGKVCLLPQGPRGQAGRPHQEVKPPGGDITEDLWPFLDAKLFPYLPKDQTEGFTQV